MTAAEILPTVVGAVIVALGVAVIVVDCHGPLDATARW